MEIDLASFRESFDTWVKKEFHGHSLSGSEKELLRLAYIRGTGAGIAICQLALKQPHFTGALNDDFYNGFNDN